MKLSKTTLATLKNFSTINQSIVIKPGNILETISNVKDIYARSSIEETFDKQVCIYDLNEFLGVVSLFEDPDLELGDESLTLKQGKITQKYFYADPTVVTSPPDNGVTLPSEELHTNLDRNTLSMIIRACSINNATDLTFSNKGILAHDKSIPSSNVFSVDIPETSDVYELSISVDKLKMVPDDYKIAICTKGLVKFEGNYITYYVALQPEGNYAKGQ